jgi:HEAT repeat protein
MLELLDLADRAPDLHDLASFLADPDAQVRRAAVATVTEVVPEGAGPALASALLDEEEAVRAAAAAALRELVEVIPATDEVRVALVTALAASDPVSRAAVLDVLRALKLGAPDLFREAAADPDHRVRLQAVRGLVSLDDVTGVATTGADPEREVRVAAAHGLGTIGDQRAAEHLIGLAGDPEPLVRAAALEAAAGLTGVEELWRLAVVGADAPEWQVRVGAVRGLATAPADVAVPPVAGAVTDVHADVRKAAVIALGAWADRPEAADALEQATKDTDADVRGYARRALAGRH